MKIAGKAVVYNHDDVSTDQIYPGPYCTLTDPKQIAEHVLEGADTTLKDRFKAGGSIFVTGENFGCGSSREMAVISLKESGVKAVVVKSVGRIWYRNAINLGLPVLLCQTLADNVQEGDELEVDMEVGIVRNIATGATYQGEVPNEFILGMFKHGGITPLIRKKNEERQAHKA